ncbi:translation initiation factor IF-2-like [Mustela putorius furo]|uniref:Translation initiation factor IF-2-like n=1 Tax=Mustela putorius furo TaxID=9669 RepID=A0A8U0V005_MUSPF|nr:translation initiation factor IF-2-like [Mustela putorius furo]
MTPQSETGRGRRPPCPRPSPESSAPGGTCETPLRGPRNPSGLTHPPPPSRRSLSAAPPLRAAGTSGARTSSREDLAAGARGAGARGAGARGAGARGAGARGAGARGCSRGRRNACRRDFGPYSFSLPCPFSMENIALANWFTCTSVAQNQEEKGRMPRCFLRRQRN